LIQAGNAIPRANEEGTLMRMSGRVVMALALTISTAALADDYPPRRPGLWEVTMGAAGAPGPTLKMCIDAETDQIFHQVGTDFKTKRCDQSDVKVNGTTVTADGECKVHGTTITTTSTTNFTGDSAYHTDIKSHFDPAFLGKTDTTMTQDGKWTGDCPADMKPGDMVLGNGIKINVKTLNMLKSLIPGKSQ
jgi:hypothetical protein